MPDRYFANFADKMLPGIAHASEPDNSATQLFEEVYQAIEEELAMLADAQTLPPDDFKIPENPLFVVTALYRDDYGDVNVLGI